MECNIIAFCFKISSKKKILNFRILESSTNSQIITNNLLNSSCQAPFFFFFFFFLNQRFRVMEMECIVSSHSPYENLKSVKKI